MIAKMQGTGSCSKHAHIHSLSHTYNCTDDENWKPLIKKKKQVAEVAGKLEQLAETLQNVSEKHAALSKVEILRSRLPIKLTIRSDDIADV